jgi:hypothetical protein
MKKAIALISILLIVVSVFTGCGTNPNKQLIGKWKDSSRDIYYEFMESGSFTKTEFSTTDGKWYITNGNDANGKAVSYLMLEYSGGDKKSLKINSISSTGLDVENDRGEAYHLEKL